MLRSSLGEWIGRSQEKDGKLIQNVETVYAKARDIKGRGAFWALQGVQCLVEEEVVRKTSAKQQVLTSRPQRFQKSPSYPFRLSAKSGGCLPLVVCGRRRPCFTSE